MSDSIIVGIDLGTTYSAVAYVDEQGRPTVVKNADGKTTTPSVVHVENGKVAVGDVALNQWITNEEHVVRWIKRAMGDPEYTFQGMTPVEISAEILKVLKRDAETQLGQSVDEAVITCPAYFAALEIENTKKAGELAGFNVREIIKEPTAAAVFYGVENMKDGETILVCDLGGGTFDATILTYAGGVFSPRVSTGSRKLGGHDWTMALVGLVAEKFQDLTGEDPRNDLIAGQRLYEACEEAKRNFSKLATVSISCQHQQRTEHITVTRQEFEDRTEPQIFEMVSWCEEALKKSKPVLAWKDIHRILLVGGSSRLRRMGEALAKASGQQPVQVREPDLAVAYGAAILARGKVKVRPRGGLVDVPSGGLVEVVSDRILVRDLGTRAVKEEHGKFKIVSARILGNGTKLPTSASREDFFVVSDQQDYFELPVVEFEDPDSAEFELVGNFRCKCLPGAKRGDRIRVTFNYDISGIPSVEAFDVKSGKNLPVDRQLKYEDPDVTRMAPTGRPRWLVFAVDVSYSMEGDKLRNAKQMVSDNARQLLNSGGSCKVGIVSFGSDATIVLHPTGSISDVERAVNALACTGSTAMNRGIRQAMNLVCGAPAGMGREIAMVTDGMPDADCRGDTLSAGAECLRQSITLYALGVGQADVDLDFLKQLSPHNAVVIQSAAGMSAAMSTLLALSGGGPSGLTDV